jgi:hypothetical protein
VTWRSCGGLLHNSSGHVGGRRCTVWRGSLYSKRIRVGGRFRIADGQINRSIELGSVYGGLIGLELWKRQ